MALISTRKEVPPLYLEQLRPSSAEVFGAAAEAAMLDNPITRISTNIEVANAERNARENNLPRLTKEQAEKMAADRGIQIHNLPQDISQEAFDILAERQYQRKTTDVLLSQSDAPMAELAGGLLGGFADPINVASAFIPVPGINGLTSQLTKAGTNIFTRSLARAQIGVIEGAFGAALVEGTINVPLAGRVGDDYGLGNVVGNVLAGAVGGSILHTTFGAFGDAIKGLPENQVKLDTRINNMPKEAKGDLVNLTMSQTMDDRPINIDFFDKVRTNQLIKELDDIEGRYSEAAARDDQDALAYYETQKELKRQELEGIFEKGVEDLKEFSSKEIKASLDESISGKGDRYMPESMREMQQMELTESPYVDIEKNLDQVVEEELLTFDEATRQMEIDGKKVLEPMDKMIKETEEFGNLAKAFANCITRGR